MASRIVSGTPQETQIVQQERRDNLVTSVRRWLEIVGEVEKPGDNLVLTLETVNDLLVDVYLDMQQNQGFAS